MMTNQSATPRAGVWMYVLYVSAGLLLVLYASPAEAAAQYAPGFLSGFVDGLLSLLKLIVSPLADFTIVNSEANGWAYKLGYGLGVLTFSTTAGAAASAAEADSGPVQWNKTN